MSVPRGTLAGNHPEPRLSVRVSPALKSTVRTTVQGLQARGLRTSESELVELLVEQGLTADLDRLEQRLRQWRINQEAS